MFYRMKVTESRQRIVLIEADSEAVAHAKARDGYGQGITLPEQKVHTELLEVEHPEQTEFRDLQEGTKPKDNNLPFDEVQG